MKGKKKRIEVQLKPNKNQITEELSMTLYFRLQNCTYNTQGCSWINLEYRPANIKLDWTEKEKRQESNEIKKWFFKWIFFM